MTRITCDAKECVYNFDSEEYGCFCDLSFVEIKNGVCVSKEAEARKEKDDQ